MKISVVIPAYNEAPYIGETLRHVLAQDFPGPFEVLVVDNASTDSTREVVKKFEGVLLLEEKRQGVQFARETGRQNAKGDVLAYLDADSMPPPSWLRKGYASFISPDVVAVAGIYDYYDASFLMRNASYLMQAYCYPALHFLIHTIIKRGGIMIGGNFFARRKALEDVGGFDTTIVFYGDDVHTALKLTRVGKIRYRSDVYVYSSARRFAKQGWFRVFGLYAINLLWVLLFERPFSQ